jgi:hypothetical protein
MRTGSPHAVGISVYIDFAKVCDYVMLFFRGMYSMNIANLSSDESLSDVSLEAIIKALEHVRTNLPGTSDKGRILLIVGESARAAGLIGLSIDDILRVITSLYAIGQAARNNDRSDTH